MIKNGWTKELKRLQWNVDCLLDICRMALDSTELAVDNGGSIIGDDYRALMESAVIRIGGKL